MINTDKKEIRRKWKCFGCVCECCFACKCTNCVCVSLSPSISISLQFSTIIIIILIFSIIITTINIKQTSTELWGIHCTPFHTPLLFLSPEICVSNFCFATFNHHVFFQHINFLSNSFFFCYRFIKFLARLFLGGVVAATVVGVFIS